MSVKRVFVEKKKGLDNEARALLQEARNLLGITALENVRLLNCYDAENISKELFDSAIDTVFSERIIRVSVDKMVSRAVNAVTSSVLMLA